MSRTVHNLEVWLAAAGLATCSTCPAAEPAGNALPKAITNSIKMKLVLIPAGEFLMVCRSPGSRRRRGRKANSTRVRITRPFYMGKYEVTQAEYKRVMDARPSHFSITGGGKLPSRRDGQQTGFPSKASPGAMPWNLPATLGNPGREKTAGRTAYRLPTEAEWDYACRAGTTTLPFHFGAALDGRQANCDGNYPYGTGEKGPYRARHRPRSARIRQMLLACTTCTGTCRSGAWMGTLPMHMPNCRWMTRKDLLMSRSWCTEAAVGEVFPDAAARHAAAGARRPVATATWDSASPSRVAAARVYRRRVPGKRSRCSHQEHHLPRFARVEHPSGLAEIRTDPSCSTTDCVRQTGKP